MSELEGDLELSKLAAAGDDAAFRSLLERHDRLVRYSVFRLARIECRRDPAFLDSVSADVWTAFLSCFSPARAPVGSVRGLLVTLARNKAISALRGRATLTLQGNSAGSEPLDTVSDPARIAEAIESLQHLRGALANLNAEDQRLMSVLQQITSKQWEQAAHRLGVPESTLRSKWKRMLEKLRSMLDMSK